MSHLYILKDGQPVVTTSAIEWARQRREQRDQWQIGDDAIGDVRISTVFLGMDHGWRDGEPPVLWETMIFGGPHDEYQERYSSLEDARAGHARAVVRVKQASWATPPDN